MSSGIYMRRTLPGKRERRRKLQNFSVLNPCLRRIWCLCIRRRMKRLAFVSRRSLAAIAARWRLLSRFLPSGSLRRHGTQTTSHLHGGRAEQILPGPEVGALTGNTVVIGVGLGLTGMGGPEEVRVEPGLDGTVRCLIPILLELALTGTGVPQTLVWLEPFPGGTGVPQTVWLKLIPKGTGEPRTSTRDLLPTGTGLSLRVQVRLDPVAQRTCVPRTELPYQDLPPQGKKVPRPASPVRLELTTRGSVPRTVRVLGPLGTVRILTSLMFHQSPERVTRNNEIRSADPSPSGLRFLSTPVQLEPGQQETTSSDLPQHTG